MLVIVALAVLFVLGLCLTWKFPPSEKGYGFLLVVPVMAGTWCFFLMGMQTLPAVALTALIVIVVHLIRMIWEADEEIWKLRQQRAESDENKAEKERERCEAEQ